MKERQSLVLLVAIVLTASYLRLHNLGVPSFWVDELDFLVAAQSLKEMGEPLLHSGYAYSRAPLFTYSVIASTIALGVSEFSTRLPSAIFGILTIPMIFVIGRSWFNTRVGLLAALMLAVAPFAIGWSRGARMYALFQLLFMAAIYAFYRGLEWKGASERITGATGGSPWNKLLAWLNERRINLMWLVLGGVLLLVSYATHQNAGLFLISFVAYSVACTAYSWTQVGWKEVVKSKYFILAGSILAVAITGYFAVPFVQEFVREAAIYQPKWAETASAQDPFRIIKFLFGSEKFPFNVLFVAGMLLVLKRRSKSGVFALFAFAVPILMFSFVFQYRKNDYIFHVYPLFYLLAALALDYAIAASLRFAEVFRSKVGFGSILVKARLQSTVPILCLVWLPLTFNFRFAQKIPRLPDGQFNGAIYHNEWKEAAEFLKNELSEQDALISTLPLTVRHYLGRVEFNLNWSNADLSSQKSIVAPDGRLVDFYSGADVIEDLVEFRAILARHERGWLLVDNYRFSNSVYVPAEIRQYIEARFTKTYESHRKTVTVFRWTESNHLAETN